MLSSTRIKFKIKDPRHCQHLCYLVNIRYHERQPDAYAELVNQGRYICKSCGRIASHKDLLCRPAKL